jgi:cytochrome c556
MMMAFAAFTSAQVKKGKTRPLQTKHWMRGVQGPTCGALSNLLKDPGPADDKAWDMAAQHAEILNESSHVLMVDGRCPDAAWADGAKQVREGSEAVLKAIEAKNVAEAKAAFSNLTKGCGTCHAAHKK